MSDMVSSNRNLAMVRAFYDAATGGGGSALTALLHPDFVAYEASSLPYSGRYEGETGLLRLLKDLAETWSEMEGTEFDYVASDESVIASFRLRATSRATGRSIDQRICEFWKFCDGKAVLLQPFYFDSHLVWEACRQA